MAGERQTQRADRTYMRSFIGGREGRERKKGRGEREKEREKGRRDRERCRERGREKVEGVSPFKAIGVTLPML